MDIETIAVMVLAIALAGFGYAALKKYLAVESIKVHNDDKARYERDLQEMAHQLEQAKRGHRNALDRIRRAKAGYDMDLDEDEDGIDPDAGDEEKLSDLVKIIYPKLPPTASKLIDSESLQAAVLKTAEKNPTVISDLIDKFTKPASKGAPQGTYTSEFV